MYHQELLYHVEKWLGEKDRFIYREMGTIDFEWAQSSEWLSYEEALQLDYSPIAEGTQWGGHWQYGWFKAEVQISELPEGTRPVLQLNLGGDTTTYINGKLAGSRDWQHRDLSLPAGTESGEVIHLLVETYAGHESGLPVTGSSRLAAVSEAWYQFFIDLNVLYQLRNALEPASLRVSEIDRGFRSLLAELDWSTSGAELERQALRGREILQPLLACVNGSTVPRLYMMGQSHLDIAWLWPLEETKRKIARTLSNQLALLEEYPEYRYVQSQPYLFQMTKELYPELYGRMKKLVAEGRIIPEGGAYVEPDTNIPSGESLVRQFLYGTRFFREEFGAENELLWLPDVFGYSGNLPQIMKKCGIRYFASVKMFQTYDNVVDPFPYNTFVWEGIDGSSVLAQLMDYGDFPNTLNVNYVIKQWKDRVQKDGISTLLTQFGYGDGGGGANRDDLETLRRLGNLEGVPRAEIATPSEFFADLQRQGLPDARYVGELYYPAHRGTFTSQAKMKAGNRQSEFALREAEIWSVYASLLGAAVTYPAAELDQLWKGLLLNQFHDILPGTSIARVHEEADRLFAGVRSSAEQLAHSAAAALTTPDPGSWTVLNSLGWRRDSILALPDGMQSVPGTQTYAGRQYARVSVPALGLTSLHTAIARPAPGGVTVSSRVLENRYLRVTLNEAGELAGLYDKETGREWLSGTSNRFRMFRDQPSRFDAWEIDRRYEEAELVLSGEAEITVGAEGPLFASLIVNRRLNESMLEQEIVLEAESRCVEFRTVVDWKERNKLLKTAFDLNLHAGEALHEIQFGYVKRPNHASRPHDADRFEVNQHKWSAMVEGERCFSILNDSKYGISAQRNLMSLSLLRSPVYPDEQADIGIHEFSYAIHTWNDGFTRNPVVREAYAFNSPLLIVPGAAPQPKTLLECSAANIIIDTVKQAEKGNRQWVVRLYESKGMSCDCALTVGLPVSAAAETDMLERQELASLKLNDDALQLQFKPFEVKTIVFE